MKQPVRSFLVLALLHALCTETTLAQKKQPLPDWLKGGEFKPLDDKLFQRRIKQLAKTKGIKILFWNAFVENFRAKNVRLNRSYFDFPLSRNLDRIISFPHEPMGGRWRNPHLPENASHKKGPGEVSPLAPHLDDEPSRILEVLGPEATPDVILFAEADKDFKFLFGETEDEQKSEYMRAFRKMIEETYAPYGFYSNGNVNVEGMGYLVRRGLKFKAELITYLPFSPPDGSGFEKIEDKDIQKWLDKKPERREYYEDWARKTSYGKHFWKAFIRIRVEKDGETLDIFPVHLANPWHYYMAEKGDVATGLQLFYGAENPHYNQMKHILIALRHLYGPNLDKAPFVLLGDFNALRGAATEWSNTFLLLQRDLVEATVNDSHYTYTAFKFAADDRVSEIKIDHVFGNQLVDFFLGFALPIHGSDHLPVATVVRPKSK